MYSSPDVESLRNFVDTQMNGEDIVMNGIVSNYLDRAGIDLNPTCHGIQIQGDRVEIKIPGGQRYDACILNILCCMPRQHNAILHVVRNIHEFV